MEAKESINQLEGYLSTKIKEIEQEMLDIMVDIEVTIDYPEYDVEEVTNVEALEHLKKIKGLLEKLEDSFEKGKILRNGIKTVILGRPNAGKSSLLNLMLKEDRAIVSDIEGTTRDSIEEYININGVALKLIDTAGIRETDNVIEKLGIEKSMKLADSADLIIAIFDNSRELDDNDRKILDFIKDRKAIIILNKVDINSNNEYNEKEILNLCKPVIKLSAKFGNGLDELYEEILKLFQFNEISNDNELLITNERHKTQIRKAEENIEKAMETIESLMPVDIISIHIKEALNDLGEITGKNVSQNIIDEIFSKFCLGK